MMMMTIITVVSSIGPIKSYWGFYETRPSHHIKGLPKFLIPFGTYIKIFLEFIRAQYHVFFYLFYAIPMV